jgi:hypothetical protein
MLSQMLCSNIHRFNLAHLDTPTLTENILLRSIVRNYQTRAPLAAMWPVTSIPRRTHQEISTSRFTHEELEDDIVLDEEQRASLETDDDM